jgi:hypothetical protein
MSRTKTRRLPRLECLESRKLLSADVTGEQQLVLELINEALVAPEAAAERVEQGLTRGAVNAIAGDGDSVEQVIAEIAEAQPKPPVAWDPALAEAAVDHTEFQIGLGRQTHDGPSGLRTATDRAIAAGYDQPEAVAENIIFGVNSPEHAMTAFLADYGPTNSNDPHRENIQQTAKPEEQSHQHVGVAVLPVEVEVQNRTPFGSPKPVVETKLVVTQVFARKEEAPPKLLGVVYDDADADRFYDVGEGVSGASVKITEKGSGDSTEVRTWSSGGYQAEVGPGDYQIEVRVGDRLIGRKEAKVDGENTKVDFLLGDAPKSSAQVAVPSSSPKPKADPVPVASAPNRTPARPASTPVERTPATPSTTPSRPRTTAPAEPAPSSPSTPAPSSTPRPKPEPSRTSTAAPPTTPTSAIDPTPVASTSPSPSTGSSEARPSPRSTGGVESSRAIERLRSIASRASTPPESTPASSAMSLLRSSLSGSLRSWKLAD